MTGGRVVVLGGTGRNFAAGMSGGLAYVLDRNGDFSRRCNIEMVELTALDDEEEIETVKDMVFRHVEVTCSVRATEVLVSWNEWLPKFVRVMPNDYRRVLGSASRRRRHGVIYEQSAKAAFKSISH